MLARVLSGAVLGIDAYLVGVETDVASGLPSFFTVGLPQGAVKEGRERVVAAIHNSGYSVPTRRITVNLAPADVRKEGSAFDLPIAIGILAGSGQLASGRLERFALVGELGLDGGLRPVRGALSIAMAVRAAGIEGLIVPRANLAEAAVVEDLDVRTADDLRSVAFFLSGGAELEQAAYDRAALFTSESDYKSDFSDVRGQEHAKRALEVAAAGAHNVLMMWRYPRGRAMSPEHHLVRSRHGAELPRQLLDSGGHNLVDGADAITESPELLQLSLVSPAPHSEKRDAPLWDQSFPRLLLG